MKLISKMCWNCKHFRFSLERWDSEGPDFKMGCEQNKWTFLVAQDDKKHFGNCLESAAECDQFAIADDSLTKPEKVKVYEAQDREEVLNRRLTNLETIISMMINEKDNKT